MTDRQYVIYFCKVYSLDLLKPTKACKDILVMSQVGDEYRQVAEGKTWKQVKLELNNWLLVRSA